MYTYRHIHTYIDTCRQARVKTVHAYTYTIRSASVQTSAVCACAGVRNRHDLRPLQGTQLRLNQKSSDQTSFPQGAGLNLGGCQQYGPFLGTLYIRCRIIIGVMILTITHLQMETHNYPLYVFPSFHFMFQLDSTLLGPKPSTLNPPNISPTITVTDSRQKLEGPLGCRGRMLWPPRTQGGGEARVWGLGFRV